MRRRLFRTPLHRIASALAALAMVVLGAHHEPHGAAPIGPDLSAYAMPGGVMPELCNAVGAEPATAPATVSGELSCIDHWRTVRAGKAQERR